MARLLQFGALTAFAAIRAGAQPFFIAPNGSDATGDGSIAAPWASVGRAQAAVRALQPLASDVTVYLRGGSYFLNETAIFTPADSGTGPNAVLHYTAWPGDDDPPVLDGSAAITSSWVESADAAGAWYTQTAVPGPTRQMYVGVNHDRVNETRTTFGLTSGDATITGTGYVITNRTIIAALTQAWSASGAGADTGGDVTMQRSAGFLPPPALQDPRDIELLFTSVGCQWVEDRVRIAWWELAADGSALNVTIVPSGWAMVRQKPYPDTFPTAFINVRGTLAGAGSAPGTGYYSWSEGRAYYVPRPGIDDMASLPAWAATLDGPLVSLQGDRDAQPALVPVRYIAFEGLTFRHNTWLRPNECGGYSPDQSGIIWDCAQAPPYEGHATMPVPGALQLHAAHNITVSRCSFEHVGSTALSIEDGSQSVVVAGNNFFDASCHAVRLGQVDDFNGTDASRFNAHVVVANNTMTGLGAEYRDCSAVFGGFIQNYTVEHNTVSNVTWAGITVGWGGWGGSPDRPTLGHGRILSNHVRLVNLVTADGGPIYVMGPQEGSEMGYNFVEHARHHAAMLYHDEGSAFWHTHHNVVNLTPDDMAANNGTGWSFVAVSTWACTEYNITVDNIWANFDVVHQCTSSNRNVTYANLTFIDVGAPWPAPAQAIIAQAGVQ